MIAAFVGVIVVAFGFQVFLAEPSAAGIAHGLFVPGFDGTESVLLAVGILGATCMPHVIYLHSALTQRRIVGATPEARRKIFRFELVDVVIAMSIAGLINMSMLITAAAVFHTRGLDDVGDDLNAVYDGLDVYLGSSAAIMFGVALLASGLSSSSVGTMAGQVVMQGFIRRQIPLMLRRAITMVPALLIIAIGVNPSKALDPEPGACCRSGSRSRSSRCVLFCRNRSLMGSLVNRRSTTVAAIVVSIVIVGLNMFLLEQTLLALSRVCRLSGRARRRAALPRAPARARCPGRRRCGRASLRRCRRSGGT